MVIASLTLQGSPATLNPPFQKSSRVLADKNFSPNTLCTQLLRFNKAQNNKGTIRGTFY